MVLPVVYIKLLHDQCVKLYMIAYKHATSVYINQRNYFTINMCDIYNQKIAYMHTTSVIFLYFFCISVLFSASTRSIAVLNVESLA